MKNKKSAHGKSFQFTHYKENFYKNGVFVCSFCESSFKTAQGLARHYGSAHGPAWINWRQEHGFTVPVAQRRRHEGVEAPDAHRSRDPLASARGEKQVAACGVNLTRLSLGSLDSLRSCLKSELEIRLKMLLSAL